MKLRYGIGLLTAIGMTMFGQTQLDLKTQSRNVDFSQAVSVRPFPTGTVLPGACKTGEMFFKSNAPAGANLYGCVAANVWIAMPEGAGNGGGTPATAPFDFQAADSVLTIGTSCSQLSDCRVLIGSTLYSYPAPATATLSGGSGTAYVYVDVLGNLTVGYGSGAQDNNITCSGCTALFNVTAFPDSAFPIAKANWTNGIWDSSGIIDERAPYSAALNIQAGPNVLVTPAPGGVQISTSSVGAMTTPSSYTTIQTAGSPMAQRATLNLIGEGVACSDDFANLRTTCSVPGGGGSDSDYDASDVTVFDSAFYLSTLAYSNVSGAFWGFTGSCSGLYNLDNYSAGQIALSFWNTGANSMCTLFAPSSGGGASGGIADFISGSNPLPYKQAIQYGRNTSAGDGDHYIGFSQAPGSGISANFVGIRGSSAAGQWQCVIRHNGTDVVSSNIMPIDTDVHWFRTNNGNGWVNSLTCQVGSATATVTGLIPAGSWFAVAGALSISGSQPRFSAGEVRLHISSRTAN